MTGVVFWALLRSMTHKPAAVHTQTVRNGLYGENKESQ